MSLPSAETGLPLTLDHDLVDSVVEKVDTLRQQDPAGVRIMSRRAFSSILTHDESDLIESLYLLSPREIGIAMDAWTTHPEPMPDMFGLVREAPHHIGHRVRMIQAQYVPLGPLAAYREMASAIRHDGGGLLIGSSYRSDAYQAGIFLTRLRESGYSFDLTKQDVALPMNSEHTDLEHTAFDFVPERIQAHQHSYHSFQDSAEYEWLVRHAALFGFTLSYPEGNPTGIKFEPWHWRFSGK